MKIEGITIDCETEAEALDAIEEIRLPGRADDDGGFDLGPSFRSLLRSADWAIDKVAHPAAADPTSS
jgi:hypothetical protein